MNTACVWPPEPARVLDLRDAGDRAHLLLDVEVGEELGVRHADRYRRSAAEYRPLREACEGKLFAAIADRHGIAVADVFIARTRVADRGLNLAVNLPMLALHVVVALAIASAIRRRFTPGERWPALSAMLFASVMVSVAILMVGEIWSALVEIVRVGNDHLSYRGLRLPWRRHRLETFAVGVVLFWCIAWLIGSHSRRRDGIVDLAK